MKVHIRLDILMVCNGQGQSSHVLVFCVNLEQHISTHIIRSVMCCIHSLRYTYICPTH